MGPRERTADTDGTFASPVDPIRAEPSIPYIGVTTAVLSVVAAGGTPENSPIEPCAAVGRRRLRRSHYEPAAALICDNMPETNTMAAPRRTSIASHIELFARILASPGLLPARALAMKKTKKAASTLGPNSQ